MSTIEINTSSELQDEIKRNRPMIRRSKRAAKELTKQAIELAQSGQTSAPVREPVRNLGPLTSHDRHKHDNTGMAAYIANIPLRERGVKIRVEENEKSVWTPGSTDTLIVESDDDKSPHDAEVK